MWAKWHDAGFSSEYSGFPQLIIIPSMLHDCLPPSFRHMTGQTTYITISILNWGITSDSAFYCTLNKGVFNSIIPLKQLVEQCKDGDFAKSDNFSHLS